ncbi:effector-associated constant component EACC1 [Streptomyces sp. NPDC001219]
MQITIRCEGADTAGELAQSLYQWLLDEPDARRHAEVRLVGAEPVEGELGFVLDLVQLVVSSGFSAGSLGYTVAQWKKMNAPQLSVTFERNGRTVTVSGTDAEVIERAVQQLDEE